MSELDITPPDWARCSISQDWMNDPVKITHDGTDYFFDRVPIDTWKCTTNGDKNPLTMMPGFRMATVKDAVELKIRIDGYKKDVGVSIDETTEKVEVLPFSDYEQIQEDEREALRLHRELNGPSPGSALLDPEHHRRAQLSFARLQHLMRYVESVDLDETGVPVPVFMFWEILEVD